MKTINSENLLQHSDIELLQSLIGVTLTKFDFNFDDCPRYSSMNNSFEVHWPATITLVTHNGMCKAIDLEFGGQVKLNQIESEFVNLNFSKSKIDYSKGKGIMMDWLEISKIEIYGNKIIEILDDKNYDDSITNFVKMNNCHELEYTSEVDEIIVFISKNNKMIMLQATESMNGSIILHFNKSHIELILANKYHIKSPRKNYIKRLTLE
ncbi:MAG: hypothetical protein IT267_06020 [Saprospiraceae bacterium]|nr:hypothetical protein [Saprospiraceae bacterium]